MWELVWVADPKVGDGEKKGSGNGGFAGAGGMGSTT